MKEFIENKYYTPDLEELCIGLECEYSTLCNTEGHNHFNWQLRDDVLEGAMDTYLLKTVITDIVEEGYEMPVRVKYLDIEDIESLGFILEGAPTDTKRYFRTQEENFGFGITVRDNFYKDGQSNIHIYSLVGDKFQTHFSGKIKNKTDFIKLLKQLDIK